MEALPELGCHLLDLRARGTELGVCPAQQLGAATV